MTQRCRPNRSLVSTPWRAMRTGCPRWRKRCPAAGDSRRPCRHAAWPAACAAVRRAFVEGMASRRSSKTTESWRLAPVRRLASGMPARSTTRWRFVPGFRDPSDSDPRHRPPFGRDARTVQGGAAPIDAVGFPQAIEQRQMQPVPDAGRLPVPQAAPAGDAAAATHLRWQQLPGDAGLEHENNPRQGRPVGYPGPAPLGLGDSGGSSGATRAQNSSLTERLAHTPRLYHASTLGFERRSKLPRDRPSQCRVRPRSVPSRRS